MSVMVVVHFAMLAEWPEYSMLMTDRSRCIRGQVLTLRRRRLRPGILWDMTQYGLVDSTKVSERVKHENGGNTFVRSLCSRSKHYVTQQELVVAFRSDKDRQFGTLGTSTDLQFCSGVPYMLLKVLNCPLFIRISDLAHWYEGSWDSDFLWAEWSGVRTSVFARFSVMSRPVPRAILSPVQLAPGLFPGIKQPERDVDQQRSKIKNSPCNMIWRYRGGLELQLYSFFYLGARWGECVTPRPGRFTPGKDPVLIV
jgi:hypothetical protein